MAEPLTRATAQSTQGDFWRFWAGQTISNFGTAFTDFALPLLIFHLAGSPLTLGITVITEVLPLGSLLGAVAIQQTQNVGLVYGVCGLLVFSIPLAFAFTAPGHAEHYLPQEAGSPALAEERTDSGL
jgi:hypothetical protein